MVSSCFLQDIDTAVPSPSFAVGFGGQARRGRDREGVPSAQAFPPPDLPPPGGGELEQV
jgi:hypothetical protein